MSDVLLPDDEAAGTRPQSEPAKDSYPTPFRFDELHRVIAAMRCVVCGNQGSTEVVNNVWSDAHGFPLYANCCARFALIRDQQERREWANEQNLKTLRQLVADGILVPAWRQS